MKPTISRRDFLKLTSLALPLALDPLIRFAPGEENTSRETRPASSVPALPTLPRPNILIIVFDALSALHMPVYGYPRSTTPNLDRFAGQSAVYHAHYAAGNFTTPGTASLLTGVYPWTHRAFNLAGRIEPDFNARNIFAAFTRHDYHCLAYSHNRLADFLLRSFRTEIGSYVPRSTFLLSDRQLMARIFRGDQRTASMGEELAFVRKDKSSLFLSLLDEIIEAGLKQAGSHESFPRGLPEAFRANFILENAVDGIQSLLHSAPQPFLGYFHLLPPHEPYRTRKEFKDFFEDGWDPAPRPAHFFSQNEPEDQLNRLRRSYDEYLAYADAEFGRLLAFMEQAGLLENTVIVFTADHGQLFERGIHGHITPVLFEPVIRIPLLIYDPNRPFRQDIFTPTSCVDLLPTLLRIAGGETPEWVEGVVIEPYQTGAPAGDRSIYSVEAKQNARNRPLSTATVAVIKEDAKLVCYYGYQGFDRQYELYDLARDAQESVNVFHSRKDTAAALRSEVEAKLRSNGRG